MKCYLFSYFSQYLLVLFHINFQDNSDYEKVKAWTVPVGSTLLKLPYFI